MKLHDTKMKKKYGFCILEAYILARRKGAH